VKTTIISRVAWSKKEALRERKKNARKVRDTIALKSYTDLAPLRVPSRSFHLRIFSSLSVLFLVVSQAAFRVQTKRKNGRHPRGRRSSTLEKRDASKRLKAFLEGTSDRADTVDRAGFQGTTTSIL
jgi:hypothetical protein